MDKKWVENVVANHLSKIPGQDLTEGPIHNSFRDEHLLHVVKFLKENIFSHFGMLCAIICDGGSHIYNKLVAELMRKYGVVHKVSTLYHP